MVEKIELVEQTNLAFDFIQRLYLEVSYLIKEMEAKLNEEDEQFIIGKPGGYGITARRSTGLEANNVSHWIFRKLAVFFAPKEEMEGTGANQITKIHSDLRLIYLRIVLQDETVKEPTVYSGVLYDIKNKATRITKFEHLMGYIEYSDEKVFKNPLKIEYEDANFALKGRMLHTNLYDINNAKAIQEKIVKPSIELYRKRKDSS